MTFTIVGADIGTAIGGITGFYAGHAVDPKGGAMIGGFWGLSVGMGAGAAVGMMADYRFMSKGLRVYGTRAVPIAIGVSVVKHVIMEIL